MKLDILVPIHTHPTGTPVEFTGQVAAVARDLDADVHALVLDADFPQAASALGNMLIDVPALIAGAKAKCREHGVAVAQALEVEMGAASSRLRTTHVEGFTGTFSGVVSTFGHYHDLVLIGIGADDLTSQGTAEAVIFGSGKPTLLVPQADPIAAFEHVMIAWDGSRFAARAVSDARVFLERAQTVTIVLVIDEKALPDDNPGKRLAECLARRGITATVSQVQGRGRPVAETLQAHASEIGAGLIIMGGFAHSRMRDFVLGGATAGILKDLRLPVLLSH
jgi:nucleotide-binding universal stress UspA family protein